MSMTTTSGTVLNGLYVGSSTPVANQKGLLIDNKYFIPLVESSSPGTDTSDATATASDILQDKTAYVNGEKITGTISSYTGSSLIIPGVEDKVLSTAEGIYLPKAVKVAGESDLLAENIKKGVSIFGIVGSLESSGGTSAEYYKCASVSSGTGAVLEGRLMTMSFIDIIDFDYATEPTVIHFTMTDTTKTGLDREWVSSDGVYTFKKYVNTAEGYISWGLYKNSDNTYSHYITTGLIDQNKMTTDAEGNTVDMRDPWEIKQLYSEAGFMDTKEISWGHSQEAVGGKTWSGYKAVFDSSTGTWSFSDTVTEGLSYIGITPVVGKIYSADTTIQVGYIKLDGILNDETVKFLLYPKLNGTLEDVSAGGNGVTVTNTGSVAVENNRIVFGEGKALTIPANTLPNDIFVSGSPFIIEFQGIIPAYTSKACSAFARKEGSMYYDRLDMFLNTIEGDSNYGQITIGYWTNNVDVPVGAFTVGVEHVVAFEYDGNNTSRVYLDGVMQYSFTGTSYLPFRTYDFLIGHDSDEIGGSNANPFQGNVSYFRIRNVAPYQGANYTPEFV